jgi:hypothetical protein
MTDLHNEQLADLRWARDVLSGRGDAQDTIVAARNMLRALCNTAVNHSIETQACAALAATEAA